ncbi:MAG: hypothetical protein ACE5EU_00390, partial [Paracoccaceae bacterium]
RIWGSGVRILLGAPIFFRAINELARDESELPDWRTSGFVIAHQACAGFHLRRLERFFRPA